MDHTPNFIEPIETGEPTISYSVHLGEEFKNVDCDAEKTTAYMRTRGFSDEQIETTTILIDDHDESDGGRVVKGEYFEGHNRIEIYPISWLNGMRKACQREGYRMDDTDKEEISHDLSAKIVHELRHHEFYVDLEQRENIRQENELAYKMQIRLAENNPTSKASLEESIYLNNPEEIECRDAEEVGPKDLITFQYKDDKVLIPS